MSGVDVGEFRALLEQERARIQNAIAYLHEEGPGATRDEAREAVGGGDNHLGDMATVTIERELGEGLETSAQQTLAQIERALARLDAGTYGTCERCGSPIGEERLRARPSATLCIDDQRLADRG